MIKPESASAQKLETISGAAIQFHLKGGVNHLCTGRRHTDIREEFYSLHKRSGWSPIESSEEGFLTNTGRFLTRKEAMDLARANGQLKYETTRAELTSEDIW